MYYIVINDDNVRHFEFFYSCAILMVIYRIKKYVLHLHIFTINDAPVFENVCHFNCASCSANVLLAKCQTYKFAGTYIGQSKL